MMKYAALDVRCNGRPSARSAGREIAEGKVPTDPDAIAVEAGKVATIGMRFAGRMAVNEWSRAASRLIVWMPVIASAALSIMPNKNGRHDAAAWHRLCGQDVFVRRLLSARDALLGRRQDRERDPETPQDLRRHVREEVGGFARSAEKIVSGQLTAAPEIGRIVEALTETRRSTRIKALDGHVRAAAKQNAMARLFMMAPGVGAVTALSVAAAYDDASCSRRSPAPARISASRQEATNQARSVEMVASKRLIEGLGPWSSLSFFTPCGRRTNDTAAASLEHNPRPNTCLSPMRPCGTARMSSRRVGTANTPSPHPFRRKHEAILAIDHGEYLEPGKALQQRREGAH
ncbi:hypothetical protein NKH09_23735 [Mesorhizobium sp. M1339]